MPTLEPKRNVIATFQNQNTEIQFALGEYIDNSIDSYLKNEEKLKENESDYKPYIDIRFDSYDNIIVIEDNCAGIHKEDEERAFSIGDQNPNQEAIGTYGMGMKVSSFWFCPNWEVETKALNEIVKKTFKINLKDALKTGKTNDSKVQSDADAFTKITLKDVYKGKIPSDTRKINIIRSYLAEMYRFMILEQKITINFNGTPLSYSPPDIFEKRYFKEKKGEAIKWVAKIPPFDLGTVKRGKKTVKLKTLGGIVYIKEKGTNKNQKGFGMFWKKRLVDGHPQRPWMPSSNEYDDKELVIYGARNQYVAQRLEGYIHLSPNFQVPSTKDGVRWEGMEELLIKQLKKYLESATLLNDESGKTYNFIAQCKKIADLNEPEKPEKPGKDDDDWLDDDEIITIPEPDDEPDVPGEDDDIFDGDGKTYPIQYEGTKWNIDIKIIEKNDEKFYKIVKGPFGKRGDKTRKLGLKINLGHKFRRYHFSQYDIPEQREGLIKFFIALGLAEAISAEKQLPPKHVRLIFNEIMNQYGDNY